MLMVNSNFLIFYYNTWHVLINPRVRPFLVLYPVNRPSQGHLCSYLNFTSLMVSEMAQQLNVPLCSNGTLKAVSLSFFKVLNIYFLVL